MRSMTDRTLPHKSWFASRALVLSASVSLVIVSTPSPVSCQDKGPYFAVGASPTLLVLSYHFDTPSRFHQSMGGVGLNLKLGFRFGLRVATAANATFVWGAERLEAYTVGPEFSFGSRNQVRITTAFGILRQPHGFDCAGICPPGPSYELVSDPGFHLGLSYGWRLSNHWYLGPSATWMRALSGEVRFHVLSLGLQLTGNR
jgi:hypothetical protein